LTIKIRLLNQSDSIPKLTQLVRKAYESLARMGLRYNGTWQDDAKTMERISGRECYVVESTGQFDATILLQPPKTADTCEWYGRGDVASFHQFAVAPELQGKGIGAKLLDFIERRAAEIGAKELAYDTAEPANHLIQYYRPRSFRFIQYQQWNDTNYRSVIMSKALSQPLGSGPGFCINALPFMLTERLCICHAASVSPKQMVDFNRRNAEFLAPTNPPLPSDFFTEEWWRARSQRAYTETSAGREMSFALLLQQDPSEVIGTIGLSNIARGPFQACNLGYTLDKDHCGQGLMTEALRRVVAYAFSELNMHRLMANFLPENEKSERLLARLGFEREGLAKNYLFINGQWRDHVLTTLTNSSWKNIFAQ
jgi:[ribosomal protein S5]-alanine N-acetyltransferase